MNKPSLIGVIAGDRPLWGHRVSALLLLLPCLLIPTQQAIATTFEDSIRPILDNHCNDCHGVPDEGPEGDFSLAQYATRDSVLAAKRTWKMVLDVVEGHEMPPADAEDLADEDRLRLVRWIRQALAEPEVDGQVNPGKPVLRHLTRLEYNNAVRDLLGLETDVFMFSERLPYEKDYFNPSSDKMPERLQIRAREYGAKYPVLLPEVGLPTDLTGRSRWRTCGSRCCKRPGPRPRRSPTAEE